MKQTSPNAWLVELERYSALLAKVYHNNRGEIWLVNNDLRVFSQRELFEELYVNQLAKKPLIDAIQRVWLILQKDHLDWLKKELADRRSAIAININSLPANFRAKIRVSQLSGPLEEELQATPWTFYTIGRALNTFAADRGVVLVRPPIQPFLGQQPQIEGSMVRADRPIAVGWFLGEQSDETKVMKERILELFHTSALPYDHRLAIGGDIEKGFELQAVSDVPLYTAERAETTEWADVPSEVDIGIVCALPEETVFFDDRLTFKYSQAREDRHYRVGWYERRDKKRAHSIAVTVCPQMGNVSAAIETIQLLHDWNPRRIVLFGLCAGDPELEEDNRKLRVGDVIVATKIIGYECQKWQEKNGESDVRHDVEVAECKGLLNDQARWLAKSKWSGIARTAGEDAGPRVWTRDMLSGEKVVDDQQKYAELVTRLKSAHRKIAGVEMEGHGVGAAAKSWRRREVEFLFVKGVSDYAFDKTDSQRELAKKNAADFLFELLDDFDGD